MDVITHDPGMHMDPLSDVVGTWWLKGLADAYAAHWAAAPNGPAGEQYLRGYALGVAMVREMYFSALNRIEFQKAAVPLEC